ncbi:MAG: hypothetical protein K6E27_12815 [Eubacterium sp.]|nr:hypothetical protein [Eubacterium sp.]
MDKKHSVLSSILKYFLVFVVTAFVCFGLLFLVTLIPRSSIRKNMLKSAEYLYDQNIAYDYIIKGKDSSKQDRYADSILLGIIWQLDSDHPLKSMMETAYFSDDHGMENEALYAAVTQSLEPNKEYLRYWHGSAIIVKPLLLFLDIKGIYIFNAVILLLLLSIAVVLMYKKKAYVPIFGLIFSLIIVSAWFVPLSLEFTWCFLVMLLFLVLLLTVYDRWSSERITVLFLVFGMITSYFDFLTTELITLFVPLLILIWLDKTPKYKVVFSRIILWGMGYSFMWGLKWVLAAIVLQKNVIPGITSQISTRVGGAYMGDIQPSLPEYIRISLKSNISCLFPLEFGWAGLIVGFIILAVLFYIVFVYRGTGFDKGLLSLYIFICILPYLRYVVMHNHSFLHHFFTYRAQMISILGFVLIMDEIALPGLRDRLFNKSKDGVKDGKK